MAGEKKTRRGLLLTNKCTSLRCIGSILSKGIIVWGGIALLLMNMNLDKLVKFSANYIKFGGFQRYAYCFESITENASLLLLFATVISIIVMVASIFLVADYSEIYRDIVRIGREVKRIYCKSCNDALLSIGVFFFSVTIIMDKYSRYVIGYDIVRDECPSFLGRHTFPAVNLFSEGALMIASGWLAGVIFVFFLGKYRSSSDV